MSVADDFATIAKRAREIRAAEAPPPSDWESSVGSSDMLENFAARYGVKRESGETDYALKEKLRTLFKAAVAMNVTALTVCDIPHPGIGNVERYTLSAGDTLRLTERFFLDDGECGSRTEVWRVVRAGTFRTAIAVHIETKGTPP